MLHPSARLWACHVPLVEAGIARHGARLLESTRSEGGPDRKRPAHIGLSAFAANTLGGHMAAKVLNAPRVGAERGHGLSVTGISLKGPLLREFDHRASRPAKVRNVSRLDRLRGVFGYLSARKCLKRLAPQGTYNPSVTVAAASFTAGCCDCLRSAETPVYKGPDHPPITAVYCHSLRGVL